MDEKNLQDQIRDIQNQIADMQEKVDGAVARAEDLLTKNQELEKEIDEMRLGRDVELQENITNQLFISRENNSSSAGTPDYTLQLRWKGKIYNIFANDI